VGNKRRLTQLGLIPAAATLLMMAAWLAPATPAQGSPSIQESPTPTSAAPPCSARTDFDPANFSDSTTIDNEWLPLVPGRKLVLRGVTEGRHRRAVLIATDLTKVINGVRTTVMWHRDYQSGELTEAELAFFAQDDDGNVWNLGQYPEEYVNGVFVGAPNVWIAGIADAEAGVKMPAEPEAGGPEYIQGFAPEIDFLVCAKVIAKDEGAEHCVPLKCYDSILVTEERSPLDPGSGQQRTYHAKEVGTAQITSVQDPEGDTLALLRDVELSAGEKLWARRKALALEDRAYEISEVYRDTPPAELLVDLPAETPSPTPEPEPAPEATPEPEPTPEPKSDTETTPTPVPAGVLVTPTPVVAPLRTVPAVPLGALQAPTRPPRSGGLLPSILPSILPASGGLPGDELGSIPALLMMSAGLALMGAYGRVYLVRRLRYGPSAARPTGSRRRHKIPGHD